MGIFELMRNAN